MSEAMPRRPVCAVAGVGPDFFVKPAAVADIALALARQDRSAWSFEVEARPYAEKW